MSFSKFFKKASGLALKVLRLYQRMPVFAVNFSVTRLAFDIAWVAIAPLSAFGLIAFYVPLVAPSIQGLAAFSLGGNHKFAAASIITGSRPGTRSRSEITVRKSSGLHSPFRVW